MESFQRFIDLRCPDCDPELFALALAIRHIRVPINYGGSDIGRPGNDSALDPHHLEACITDTVEMTWKNNCFGSRMAPHAAGVSTGERRLGERANIIPGSNRSGKSDQKVMKYFSMIAFTMDCYTYMFASRVYQTTLRSVIERLMGTCWHGESTSSRAKKERFP